MRSLLVTVLLVAACGDDATQSGIDAPGPPVDGSVTDGATSGVAHWVLGYYVGYQIDALPIADIDWTALSHIAFAPMTVNGDGSLNLSFDDSHGTGIADAMALASAAHAHGVVPLLMLGGAGAGPNIARAATDANRPAFVADLLAAMDMLGYDGIDLDWEDSVVLDDLVSLAEDLRAARPGIVLTYPSGTINGNFQTVDARFADLAAAIDQFNVQTYYPSTAVTGQGWSSWFLSPLSGVTPSTPIAADDTLERFHAIGIPNQKLGIGAGFYAICYSADITGPRQPTSESTTITGGDNDFPLSAFFAAGGALAANSAARRYDDVAKQPYLAPTTALNDAHCAGPTRYISYEDEQSLADKGAWMKANGYGGIIVWTLAEGWLPANATGGRPRNALMQAMRTAFLE